MYLKGRAKIQKNYLVFQQKLKLSLVLSSFRADCTLHVKPWDWPWVMKTK